MVLLLVTFVILVTESTAHAEDCRAKYHTFVEELSVSLGSELKALEILKDPFPVEGKDHDKKVTLLQSEFSKSLTAFAVIRATLIFSSDCLSEETKDAIEEAFSKASDIDFALRFSEFTLFPVDVYRNMLNRAIERKKDSLEAFWGDAKVQAIIPECPSCR
jgi:hypothetical protein